MIVYVGLVVMWLLVLVPWLLMRHNDHVRENSVDRFSASMERLSTSIGDRREVVMPARRAERPQVDGVDAGDKHRRRTIRARRLMVAVLGAVVVVGVLAVVALAPFWSPAIPAVLLVGLLIHLRRQTIQQQALARRRRVQEEAAERRRARGHALSRAVEVEMLLPSRVDRADSGAMGRVEMELETVAASAPGRAAEFYDALSDSWEPVPVPLPTYVLAPKAPRSVRVIDLAHPGSWTSSGHLDAKEIAALEAERQEAEADAIRHEPSAGGESIVTGQVVIERRPAVGD